MKKLIFLVLAVAVTCEAFTLQSREITVIEKKNPVISDSSNNVTVVIGNDLLRFDGNDSLVIIKMADRSLNIRESAEGRKVDIERYDKEYRQRWDDDEKDNGARHFRGHWAGLEFGFNNYLYASSMTLPDEISYMTLNTTNSNCFNLNISQVNIGLSKYAGFVSGLGLNWNTYRFDNPTSIMVGANGNITEYIPDSQVPVKKSKFNVLYLNIPLMLELQLPAGYSNRLNIAAGVIGGIKLNARTKIVFEDGEKVKDNGDYNLNLLRGGVTARIGYQNFMIFGTYYLTSWFQDLRGPEGYNLKPFEIGFAFTFND